MTDSGKNCFFNKMITPVRMSKIRVVGPKTILKKTTEILHSEAVVHLEDFKPSKYNIEEYYFDIGTPFKEASNYSAILVRLRSLIANLGIEKQNFTIAELSKEPEKQLKKIESDYSKLSQKLKEIENEKKELEKLEEPLIFLTALGLSGRNFVTLENIAVFKGYYEREFENEVQELTKNYQLRKGKIGKRKVFALFIDKRFEEKARKVIDSSGYAEVFIPLAINFKTTEELKKGISDLNNEEKKIKEQVGDFRQKHGQFIVSYENSLRRENEKAEAPLRFGETKNTFVVEGFVPTKRFDSLQERLLKSCGKKIHIEKGAETEFAPTQLENPSVVKPFEFFLELYSTPFYRELDPTFLIFFTFPFFFGFMLGDVGYGIVTAILFGAIRLTTKSRALKGLMNAMLLASFATIIFGFIFGEFFGGAYFGLTPIIHREVEINFMMLLTILVGLIHVNLGFVLGFINVAKSHGIKHAILEKASWMVLEIGGILMLLKMYNFFYTTLPYQLYVGLAIVLVGLAMLVKGHGIFGIIEVPTIVSNILSYTRLFAIGLASVALAAITNEFATEFFHKGGILIAAAIGILVIGHVTNIILGILAGFLQSLRLHYVEFFTKFYRGEGKRYNPFGG